MELRKVDFLVAIPRRGTLDHVQCYIRPLSAWAAREYRRHLENNESELAVASLVHNCCVTEKYEPAFTEDEVLHELDGDAVASLFDIIQLDIAGEKKS